MTKTTKREQVLIGLFGVLTGSAGPVVLRGETLPERVPAGGVIILRDGDPGQPQVLMSPPLYVYEHRAGIEVVVAGTPAERDVVFDGLMAAIGAAIDADRTLAGFCDYVETAAPESLDLAVEGAPGLKAAALPVILHYATPDPLV